MRCTPIRSSVRLIAFTSEVRRRFRRREAEALCFMRPMLGGTPGVADHYARGTKPRPGLLAEHGFSLERVVGNCHSSGLTSGELASLKGSVRPV